MNPKNLRSRCTYLIYAIAILFALFLTGCGRPTPPETLTITMSLGEQEWKVFSNTIEGQIRNMFEEYAEALKNYDVTKYKYLISNKSIRSGEGNVKPFQMKNQYNQVYNNLYNIRISRNRKEALLTFENSRNGTANPYIVIYEDNRWKVDLIQMWRRIRFGSGNRWYWVDEWDK